MAALDKMYDMGLDGRLELGLKGARYVRKNYNFDDFNKSWVDLMMKIHEEQGSWETRKNYSGIRFKEVA